MFDLLIHLNKESVHMIDLLYIMKEALKFGIFESISSLEKCVKSFEETYPDLRNSYNDGSGNKWVEYYDHQGNLMIMLHTKYKVAFIKNEYAAIKIKGLYCIPVNTFSESVWFISNTEIFNSLFPFMSWNEPEHVVNSKKFSLLDFRFVTE